MQAACEIVERTTTTRDSKHTQKSKQSTASSNLIMMTSWVLRTNNDDLMPAFACSFLRVHKKCPIRSDNNPRRRVPLLHSSLLRDYKTRAPAAVLTVPCLGPASQSCSAYNSLFFFSLDPPHFLISLLTPDDFLTIPGP